MFTYLRQVMADSRLSVEAKAIFSYMYLHADEGQFGNVARLKQDLRVSDERFYKYRNELLSSGYATVQQSRSTSRSRYAASIYTLNSN